MEVAVSDQVNAISPIFLCNTAYVSTAALKAFRVMLEKEHCPLSCLNVIVTGYCNDPC